MDRLLTKKEVAHLLGITTRTVDAWEQKGLIPKAHRIGGVKNPLTGSVGYKRWKQSDLTALTEA